MYIKFNKQQKIKGIFYDFYLNESTGFYKAIFTNSIDFRAF